GVEVSPRECGRRERKREQRHCKEPLPHRAVPEKYVASERPSSRVYASAYVTAAATATCGRAAAVATSTTSNAIALKKTPNACTAEPARLAVGLRARASTRSSACTNSQSRTANPQPGNGQPSSRNRGSAATSSTPRRAAGSIRRQHTNFVTAQSRFAGRKVANFVSRDPQRGSDPDGVRLPHLVARQAVLRSARACSSRRRMMGLASFTISSR